MSTTPQTISDINRKNIIFNVIVSGLTFQVYDFFQTLELEYEYIWKFKFNALKFLYLSTKYLPFIDVPLLACAWLRVEKSQWKYRLTSQVGRANWTVNQCRTLHLIVSCSFALGAASSQVLLTWRTLVLWGRPRWLMWFLATLGAFMCIYGLANLKSGLASVQYPAADLASRTGGCTPIVSVRFQSSKLWINWMLYLMYDGILCILLVVRLVVGMREGQISHPICVMYREGITYYVYTFVMSIAFIIWLGKSHQDGLVPVSILTRILHPLLSTRVVMHARQQASLSPFPSVVVDTPNN